tara:strand:- start:5575 stop:5994 length:420 start_codon:yes stop_codon:yes gene_type:complete
MKVKELIEQLKDFPEDRDVWVCNEIEGDDRLLSGVVTSRRDESLDFDSSKGDFQHKEGFDIVLLRWREPEVLEDWQDKLLEEQRVPSELLISAGYEFIGYGHIGGPPPGSPAYFTKNDDDRIVTCSGAIVLNDYKNAKQ